MLCALSWHRGTVYVQGEIDPRPGTEFPLPRILDSEGWPAGIIGVRVTGTLPDTQFRGHMIQAFVVVPQLRFSLMQQQKGRYIYVWDRGIPLPEGWKDIGDGKTPSSGFRTLDEAIVAGITLADVSQGSVFFLSIPSKMTYYCPVCRNPYDTGTEAAACAALGEPPKQEFAAGQMVILPRFGLRVGPQRVVATRVWRVQTKSGPRHAHRYGVQVYGRVRWYDAASLEPVN